jgi:hypothetical protein
MCRLQHKRRSGGGAICTRNYTRKLKANTKWRENREGVAGDETQNRERFDVDHRAKQRTNLEKIEQKESRRVLKVWRESLVKQGNSRQGMNTAHWHHRDSRAGEKRASHPMQMQ